MNTTAIQLRRIRWFVQGCFWLGIAASVAANILHADPNPISQAVAAWAPLALLLSVELLSRVPISTRSARSWLRLIATAIVAAIAAWVSYWHMVGVATQYGETGYTPYLLPISVDGLVVIASISLVELSHRLRALEATNTPAAPQPAAPQPEPAPEPVPQPKATPEPAAIPTPEPAPAPEPVTPQPAPAPVRIPPDTTQYLANRARRSPQQHNGAVQDALL